MKFVLILVILMLFNISEAKGRHHHKTFHHRSVHRKTYRSHRSSSSGYTPCIPTRPIQTLTPTNITAPSELPNMVEPFNSPSSLTPSLPKIFSPANLQEQIKNNK